MDLTLGINLKAMKFVRFAVHQMSLVFNLKIITFAAIKGGVRKTT